MTDETTNGTAAAAAAAAAVPEDEEEEQTIWDTVAGLAAAHPPLGKALRRVRQKIEKCLCQSYSIVDPPNDDLDHASALMNLKGSFGVATDPKEPLAYGFTNANGVFLNAELVAASDAFYNFYGLDMDEYMENLDGLAYVSILEETIEHELGHLKNHQRLMNNPSFSQTTEAESPLKAESGYAVQLAIRQRFFGPNSKLILQASEQCHGRRFRLPVKVRLVEICVRDDKFETTGVSPSHPLSIEQLKKHMNYPPDDKQDPTCETDANGRQEDTKLSARELRREERNKRKERDGSGGAGRGGGTSSKKSRRDSTTSKRAAKAGGASDAADEQQACTDSNGVDPYVQIYDDATQAAALYSTKCCELQLEFCDVERNKKGAFLHTENIYTLLTVKNPTNRDDVYATLRGAGPKGLNLGRTTGMTISVQGQKRFYTPTGERGKDRMVKIGPHKSYTFFRMFCASRSSDYRFYPNWTPEKKGTYTAVVTYPTPKGSKEMGSNTFEIISNGDSSGQET